eukprot:CAMPEP_0195520452 /NCGR_PEP_ID=MMETSP0794_2-20130614/16915_1 /TAXON_ID=515487 /ORGANISM="Stephanopyxis turris, Strain CCMP 815" /LENGTH=456 /DNA_ID=CAMNT_0040649815 /DNA_START=72 /DNA_END=1442 /DNA_ORIENTATION=+
MSASIAFATCTLNQHGTTTPITAASLALPKRPNGSPIQRIRQKKSRNPNQLLRSPENTRSRFTYEYLIPPLEPIVVHSSSNKYYRNNTLSTSKRPTAPTPIISPLHTSFYNQPLPVTYTNDPSTIDSWLSQHITPSTSIVGFDTESVPRAPWITSQTIYKGPATIQLSTHNAALVISLRRRKWQKWGDVKAICTTSLRNLLASKRIIKAGVGIDEDMLDLYRLFGRRNRKSSSSSRQNQDHGELKMCCRFDMGGIGCGTTGDGIVSAKRRNRVGLKGLMETVLGLELVKSMHLSVSNWSKYPLKPDQLAYCARDAWAGAVVLDVLGSICDGESSGSSNGNDGEDGNDKLSFAPEAIREMVLRDERSMRELDSRACFRKQAKTELKRLRFEILRQYSGRSEGYREQVADLGGGLLYSNLPSDLYEEKERLRKVLRETMPDALKVIDTNSLGFSFLDQ